MKGKGAKRRLSFQRTIQLLSAVLVNGYAAGFQKGRIFTGGTKAVCVPVLNCYSCPGALGACPIGSLQAAVGGMKRHFPFYVLGLLMLFGIVLGRVVCGLLCPFGLVQDLLHKIPVPKRRVPKKIDRPARYLKYLVLLALVILLPAFAVTKTGVTPPYFCQYVCPAGTLGGGIPLMIADPALRTLAGALFSWKALILVVIAAASMFIHRPFCRYLCPLGAFYAVFNRFSFFQMNLDETKCIGCKKCEHICPMVVEVTKNINGPECIRCGMCKAVCPTGAIASGFACGVEKPRAERLEEP
jgi:polyferredoxin